MHIFNHRYNLLMLLLHEKKADVDTAAGEVALWKIKKIFF